MPHALELPGMLRTVVPLMRGERRTRRVIDELIALPLRHPARPGGGLAGRRSRLMPCLAAIIRALNNLSEPAAGLRGINAVGIDRRSLQVINLPARKKRPAYTPLLAFAVRCKDECAFARAYQNSYSSH